MRIEYYWKELKNQLPPEQVFYITVLCLFQETIRVKQDRHSRREESPGKESVAETVREVPDYDFKENMLRLSERIAWELLQQDMILDVLEELTEFLHKNLRRAKQAGELRKNLWLLQQEIWTLAEREGLLMPTPDSILWLMEELFCEIRVKDMLDMCCGTSCMGYAFWEKSTAGSSQKSYTGVEANPVLCSIAQIQLYLEEAGQYEVIQQDILEPDACEKTKTYDFIFADIPRGNNRPMVCDGRDRRIAAFEKKKIYTDWIFIQDLLMRLKEGGYAVALVTAGVLMRENEKQLRQQVIESDWLEAVISLPANLYTNVHTTTEMLIFHKGKQPERQNKVLFADIHAFRERQERNAYEISYEGIRIAREVFCNYRALDGMSVICDTKAMEQETLSWKPFNYLRGMSTGGGTIKLETVAEIVRGAQIKPEEIRISEGGVKFINVKDIQNEQICYETAENVDDARLTGKPQFRIREDDILLISKGTVIKLALAKKSEYTGYISGNITILRVNRSLYHPYVLYDYLQSGEGHDALECIQSGTTIRILNNTNLKKLDIPKYPAARMQEVGELLRQNQWEYDRRQKELTAEYLRQKKQLQERLKGGTDEDGKNIFKP